MAYRFAAIFRYENVRETLAGRLGLMQLFSLIKNEKEGVVFDNELDFSLTCLQQRSSRVQKKNDLPDVFNHIWHGGMPQALSADAEQRQMYFDSYIDTYLMRDVTELGGITDSIRFRRFSMKRGDATIGDDNKRSQRPWILLKYLLTHHDKQIVQEDFFDIIWQDGECDNPVKALQNLVYRLRQMLNKDTPAEYTESSISFNQGCYSWNKHYPYQLDTDEFEDLYNRASQAYRMGNQHLAAELFTSALHLYKGDYLADLSFNDWVIPARNHYRQLYLDAMTKMVQIYKDSGKLQEILNICENALMIDPYEEKIHEHIIETLIEMGRLKLAQTHYEYVTAMLYKDLGVKPSPSLRGLFRRLKMNNEDIQMDLNAIKDCLMEKMNCDKAFLCDKETFQSMYKVECRRLPRSGQSVFLAMLTTTCANYELPDRKSLKVVADVLLDIICKDLRSGDVLTKWNESQFLVMLPGTTFEQADKITARIQCKFELKCKEKDIVMRRRVMPIGDVAKQNLSTSFL